LGLPWRDVDFDRGLIHVRRALDRKRRDVPPKTERAVRDVILMPALAEALRQHKRGTRFNQPDDYVFTTRTGTPHHAPHIGLRALRDARSYIGAIWRTRLRPTSDD
jgi:integrase